MSKSLDIDYPMGNPAALFCRHCQARRAQVGSVLLCRSCDGNAFQITYANKGK